IADSDRSCFRRFDLFDVGAHRKCDVGDHLHEALEKIVARDEIGFGVNLDDDALGALHLDTDQAFGCNPAGFLRGLRQAFLAQPILRRRQVALGLGKGGLAVHHAGAGRLAQLLDHLGADICHSLYPYSVMAGLVPAIHVFEPARRISRGCPARGPLKTVLRTFWPGMTPLTCHSAVNSLALAIQLSTRPGKPTSSPTLCAAFSLSSAICVKWKMPRSLSCFSIAGDTPGSFLRSSATPRGPGNCSKPRSPAAGAVGICSVTTGFSAAPISTPISPWAREIPSIAAFAMRSQ